MTLLEWPEALPGGAPLLIAHRGASGVFPENTEAAFSAALAAGVRTWECDVRLTRDGVPVVIHDPDLGRTTDGKGLVRDTTLADLRKLSAGYSSRFSGRFSRQRVPTLEETLRLARGEARLLIELKTDGGDSERSELLARLVVDHLEAAGAYSRTALISFDRAILGKVRNASSRAVTGLLVAPITQAGTVERAAAIGARFVIAPRSVLSEGFAEAARAASLLLATYTVERPEELTALRSLGLYGVATDYPERFVGVPGVRLA